MDYCPVLGLKGAQKAWRATCSTDVVRSWCVDRTDNQLRLPEASRSGLSACLSTPAVCLLLAAIPVLAPGAEPLPTLTEVRQILQLSADDIRKGLPVRIEGVVTLADEEFGLLFVQDGTAGIFVDGLDRARALKDGQSLRIEGVTAPGLFSPIVSEPKAVLLGDAAASPAPRRVDLGELSIGKEDAQLVEVEGIVQMHETIGRNRHLEIVSGEHRCHVWLLGAEGQPSSLLDAKVRIWGVCAAQFDTERRLTGFSVYSSSTRKIAIIEPAPPDPFASLPVLVRDFVAYPVLRRGQHRIRVQGVVTGHAPNGRLFIQDSTGGIALHEVSRSNLWRVGDLVDAAGFRIPGSRSELAAAVIRKAGEAAASVPAPVMLTRAPKPDVHNKLVQLDGELIHSSVRSNLATFVLVMKGEAGRVTALWPSPDAQLAAKLENGNQLRITGVCQLSDRQDGSDPNAVLWLRSFADIQIVGKGGWRAGSAEFWRWTLALGVGGGAAGAIWLWSSHRARRQIEQDRQLNQRELQRYIEDRERIGQDLHDNIIQSVYAIGLGLEDCQRFCDSPAGVEQRLATAISALNGVMRDVRQFIGGLEPKALNGDELRTALKSLALTTGDSNGQFRIQVDAAATRILTPQQATHLLNIAKEAMSNSLRHANARQTTVAVSLAPGHVRLEVADDGVGFDGIDNGSKGGTGLRNIAARARDMGARLEVISAPSKGARIIVAVPVRT